MGPGAGTNCSPNHNVRGFLAMIDDGRCVGSLCGPAPIALVIVGLLNGEEDFVPLKESVAKKESFASFKLYALVIVGEEMTVLELIELEMDILLFGGLISVS